MAELRNAGSSCQKNCSTSGALTFVIQIGDQKLPVVLRDRQLQGLDVERCSDPRQRFLKHQHHEQAFLAPSRLADVERRSRAHQSKDAIERERLFGLDIDAR